MSKDWYLLNTRPNHVSGFETQEFSEHAGAFEELLEYSPEGEDIFIEDSEESVRVILQNTQRDFQRTILSTMGLLSKGNIITIRNEKWLVIGLFKDNTVFQTAQVQKCNTLLKWIDNNQIHSYPCILEFNTRSNFGVKDDRIMSLADGRRQVIVGQNEHTRKIKRDKRFLFGGEAFIVIDFDNVSDEGITNLALKDNTFNSATDNLELGIANYYDNPIIEEPDPIVTEGYTIEVIGASSIRINQTEGYNANVYNNGVLVVENVIWSLFADDGISATSLATITSQDNDSCVLKSNSSSGYVRLKASLVSDGLVVGEIRVQMKSLF